MNKKITASEDENNLLIRVTTKNADYAEVMGIDDCVEFSDEQARFYNDEIDRIENGIYENVHEISLAELEARVSRLENE